MEKKRKTERSLNNFLKELAIIYDLETNGFPEDQLKHLSHLFGKIETQIRENVKRKLADLDPEDPLLSPVSLFTTTQFGRLEVFHSETLAWLLNPEKEHGFGDLLLKRLLSTIADQDFRSYDNFGQLTVYSQYHIRNKLLDIFINGSIHSQGNDSKFMLVIETKINAREGQDQLNSYFRILEEDYKTKIKYRKYLYLTPEGDKPSSTNWEKISFLELGKSFREASLDLKQKPGYPFLRLYLAGLFREILRFPVPLKLSRNNLYEINYILGKGL